MRFTLATVVAVLPFLATASPTAYPSLRDGIKIPLAKRSSLTLPNGSVNITLLRNQVARTSAKIQRGFNAFERNTGIAHPASGSAASRAKRSSGHNPLTDDENSLWYGEITVGTPATTYTVDFDTGSSDLFLPGSTCGSTCSGHTLYNPSSSSTAKNVGKTFSLAYGDGSTVSGEQYTDVVTLAGLTATKQTLGSAKEYSTGFESSQFPADGLLGMGFEGISDYGASPVFQTLISQSQTTKPHFGFKLSTSGAELTIGKFNTDLYSGSLTYVPVTTEGYWQVTTDAVSVGGKKLFRNVDSIIDTGTTLVIGTPSQVKTLYASVPGSAAATEIGDGYYTFPCDSVPDVSLTFGGKSFAISAETFSLGPISDGSSECVGGVAGVDVGADFWIMGDVFLQNVYAGFDVGESRVGFAELS